MITDGSMYLVLPVPFRVEEGRLFVESQAANGLDRWADNFSRLTVAAPVIPEHLIPTLAGVTWLPFDGLEHAGRVETELLPWAYAPRTFFGAASRVRAAMGRTIAKSQFLQFAIGGMIGDWAAVAALEAIQQKRRYAIHTDRVEHEVMRKTASSQSLPRRLRIAVEAPLIERYHRHLIEHCTLGLWHGEDCYRAYSPWCKENHLIHDLHTKAADLIGEPELAAKLADVRSSATLRLCYAGRLDPMKAPLEWLQAIAAARDAGTPLDVTWYGEGSMMAEAVQLRDRVGLESVVHFPGFVSDRATLLASLRKAHALVFTHVTPESPRILLEALVSGTPILGYDNAYAANLLESEGGGSLVPLHATDELGRLITQVAQDRELLVQLTIHAAKNGTRFTDAAVFEERSDLIKRLA